MDAFLSFAGNFWWLIFPIMGMAGGAARAWERALKRRHQRRLEIIEAKSGLRAARLESRSAPTAPGVSHEDQLTRLFAEHDETDRRWLDYELDVAKLIAFPAMSDGRQPLTAAFLRAKRVADGLRPPTVTTKVSDDALAQYADAVHDYAVAFDVAERDARRLRDSSFSEDERRRLSRAQQLLKVAVDDAASPAERQVAYRRVREELDGLIVLSDDAVTVLEKKVAHELPATPTPLTPPEATT